jgi:hypothetical protein
MAAPFDPGRFSMRPRFRAIAVLTLLAAPTSALAQAPSPASPTCSVPADDSWTQQEKIAWARICSDMIADFTAEPGYGGGMDPQSGNKLPENQTLSAQFIATILTDDTYRGALKRHGVRVTGAQFTEPVDLQNIKLESELWFEQCNFEKGADLSFLQTTQPVAFNNSKVTGSLRFFTGQLGSDLHLKDSVIDEVDLSGAHIGRTVDLSGAHIGRTLEPTGALNMPGLDVGVDLAMLEGVYNEVDLHGAHIGHMLDLTKSNVVGEVKMGNLQVGTDLKMVNAVFSDEIDLRYSQMGGELDWRGASFAKDVDLTAARVSGALELGSALQPESSDELGPARWFPGVGLTARYAKVAIIPRVSDAWPDKLDIVGLTYDGIADTDDDFHAWFERQKYSRQPYEQLATVLQARGEIEMATNVRYAEREGDRNRSYSEQRWPLFGWLTLLKWGIGYGYYPYYSLVWVVGFVLVGSIVLFISGEGRRNGLPYGVSYSFDLLLPIIRLREQHYRIDLAGWARYYFYIHKIMGWVLASFLVAGLSGLTK